MRIVYDVHPWLVQCRLARNQNGDAVGTDIQSSGQKTVNNGQILPISSFIRDSGVRGAPP